MKSSATALATVPLLNFPTLDFEVLPNNITLLFQGDSITDASRVRANYYPNNGQGMGNGYVFHIVTHLMGNYPKTNWQCYNRGISGNKVFQLEERWKDDCMQLKPDVLSILIGVNDFWHTLTSGYTGTVNTYENELRNLLSATKKELPHVKLILGQPFVVKGGTAVTDKAWLSTFVDYQQAAFKVAKEFNAVFIPYQQIFDEALKVAPVSYWCPDGVHPSMAGAYLMAKGWLEAFEKMMK
jgi:lysophospholipase L1-like esterase